MTDRPESPNWPWVEGLNIVELRKELRKKMEKRPPNDRGQGRKPLPPGEKLIVGSVRLSPAQWAKLEKLGGASWLRAHIDRAKLP